MCSTSQPAIARLEKGQVAPTVVSLDRIARALGAELVIDFEPVAAIAGERAAGSPGLIGTRLLLRICQYSGVRGT